MVMPLADSTDEATFEAAIRLGSRQQGFDPRFPNGETRSPRQSKHRVARGYAGKETVSVPAGAMFRSSGERK